MQTEIDKAHELYKEGFSSLINRIQSQSRLSKYTGCSYVDFKLLGQTVTVYIDEVDDELTMVDIVDKDNISLIDRNPNEFEESVFTELFESDDFNELVITKFSDSQI